VIDAQVKLDLPLEDLSALPEEQREAAAQRLAQAEAQRPFDLARGPLLRARLLRISHEEHIALLTLHHIVSDGWSMGVLVREVAALYAAFVRGEASPLAELPVQYADYAHWQREWLQGDVLAAQLDYWKTQLSGAPALLALPTDRPRPAVQRHAGDTVTTYLPAAQVEQLRNWAGAHNGTLFMALLAVLKVVLWRWTGQTDLVVGTVVAGRSQAAVEPLIGCFMNFVPLRTRCEAQEPVSGLLGRLRASGVSVREDAGSSEAAARDGA
jgi:pristinamycin I synthase-3/4